MRLFVAIDPTDAARRALVEVQRRVAAVLGPDAGGVRWVRPEYLHATLLFLGDIGDARVPAIVEACSRPLTAKRFDVVFTDLGVFPSRGAPRVLWVGFESEGGALASLHREVAQRVRAAGEGDAGVFRPHLTLGRWRRSRPLDRGRATSACPPGPLGGHTVDRVTLYRSELPSVQHAAPVYTALAHANLTSL